MVYSCCFSALFSPSQRSCSNSTALTHALHRQGSLNATCLWHLPHHNYPFPGSVMLPSLWGWLLTPSLRCLQDTEASTLHLSPKTVPSHHRMGTGLGNRDHLHLCSCLPYLGAWLSSAGPRGCMGQCLPSLPCAGAGQTPSHEESKAALTLSSAACCLFLLLSAGLERFIHRPPASILLCRRAVIRTARASSCLCAHAWRASSPADPELTQ